MSRLARDGTAEPVSRDQILRREREEGKYQILVFLVQLTTCRIGNLTRLIHILAICVTIHKLMSKKFSPWSQGRKTPSSGRKKVGTAFSRHKENTVMIQKYSEKATSPKKQKKREKQK